MDRREFVSGTLLASGIAAAINVIPKVAKSQEPCEFLVGRRAQVQEYLDFVRQDLDIIETSWLLKWRRRNISVFEEAINNLKDNLLLVEEILCSGSPTTLLDARLLLVNPETEEAALNHALQIQLFTQGIYARSWYEYAEAEAIKQAADKIILNLGYASHSLAEAIFSEVYNDPDFRL